MFNTTATKNGKSTRPITFYIFDILWLKNKIVRGHGEPLSDTSGAVVEGSWARQWQTGSSWF